jgi:hypothetical protein
MNTKDLYKKLQQYFEFDVQDSIFQSILKSILLLLSGAFLGAFIRELSATPSKFNLLIFSIIIVSVGLFIYLEMRRLKKEKNFPVKILDHLNATSELEELQRSYNRKVKIDGYIDTSIQSLNANTCPVLYSSPENQLCHQDLKAGLNNVIKDFVERTHYFLDLDKSKFTVGNYLDMIYDPNSQPGNIKSSEVNYVFRDDLSLSDFLPTKLLDWGNETEETFTIHTALVESYTFGKYLCKKITCSDKLITLICSPIPNVCENCPSDGVLYCIYEGHDSCPMDIGNVLLIQGRILSNWVSKFNDCVHREKIQVERKQHEHKKILIPDEVKELLNKPTANQ